MVAGLIFAVVAGYIFAVSISAEALSQADQVASVVGATAGVLALLVALLGTRAEATTDSPADLLSDTAARVATEVERQWVDELAVEGLADGYFAVQVSWTSRTTTGMGAPPEAVYGAKTRRRQVRIEGSLDRIATEFLKLPRRQLVVLGDAGSGKTTLAVRLAIDLLRERTPEDPVPVVFSIASWRPQHVHIEQWLADQLRLSFPALAAGYDDSGDVAYALVTTGRILPVLDGLDELPPALVPKAIDAINQSALILRPLVLTCRTDTYRRGNDQAEGPLVAAAVIELQPLSAPEVVRFLASRAHPRPRWQPVLDYLTANPDSALALALRTTLFAWLYQATFARPHTNPEQLSTAEATDPQAIRRHLLVELVPRSYEPVRRDEELQRYSPEQARRWLRFTATFLDRAGTNDIAWWYLRIMLPGPLLRLPALTCYTVCVAGAVIGFRHSFTAAAVGGLAGLLGTKALFDQSFRLAPSIRPRYPNLSLRDGRAGDLAAGLLTGAFLGGLLGFVVGFVPFFYAVFVSAAEAAVTGRDPVLPTHEVTRLNIPYGMAVAVGVGVVVGTLQGLLTGFLGWLNQPVRDIVAPSPHLTLRRDRVATLVTVMAYMLVVAASGAVVAGLIGVAWLGLVVGAAVGLSIGLLSTAWGWYRIALMWCALRGQLPWRYLTFLDDARRRRIIRRAGTVHQFRHVLLKQALLDGKPASTDI
ncbi:NACHT domain-containing protein [Micromonospora wenchangensis]